ncbi:hypothetical protein QFC19_003862 [Naganishia cerealis]|uniref:Uncharacterized protein n=1 Tax=Naganishia cerealis TaxID=610337 RepID=A0ACC2W0R2_9TREE|nr:hypothetical protein QFC19_003862 [Naganishia cerealis]
MAKKTGVKGSIRLPVKAQKPKKDNKKAEKEPEVAQDSPSDDLDDEDDVDEDDSEASGSESEASESESESDAKSEAESGSESDSDAMPKKKRKTGDGSQEFANAFNAIIGSKLKAHRRNDPIMARSKNVQKQLDSAKLEAKAKKQLLAEKKALHDSHRVKNLLPSANEPEKVRSMIEDEKKLKKVAQRGVVRLFNAVLSTQIKTTQEVSGEKVGLVRKEELLNEVSKEQFLDLVQAAGHT